MLVGPATWFTILDDVCVCCKDMWDLCRDVSGIDNVFGEACCGTFFASDTIPPIRPGCLTTLTVGLSHIIFLAIYWPGCIILYSQDERLGIFTQPK